MFLSLIWLVLAYPYALHDVIVDTVDRDVDGNGRPDKVLFLRPEFDDPAIKNDDPGEYWQVQLALNGSETTELFSNNFLGERIPDGLHFIDSATRALLESWGDGKHFYALLPVKGSTPLLMFVEYGFASTPPRVAIFSVAGGAPELVFERHAALRRIVVDDGKFVGLIYRDHFQETALFYSYVETVEADWNSISGAFELNEVQSREMTMKNMGVYIARNTTFGPITGGAWSDLVVVERDGKREVMKYSAAEQEIEQGKISPADVYLRD